MQKEDIANIRNNLKYGDNQKIKKVTGRSLSFISEVLNGKKNSDEILEAASRIAAENIARKEAIKAMLPPASKPDDSNDERLNK